METALFLNGKGLPTPYPPLRSYCPVSVALDDPQRHTASVEDQPEGACLKQRAFPRDWPPQMVASGSACTQRCLVWQTTTRVGIFLPYYEVISPLLFRWGVWLGKRLFFPVSIVILCHYSQTFSSSSPLCDEVGNDNCFQSIPAFTHSLQLDTPPAKTVCLIAAGACLVCITSVHNQKTLMEVRTTWDW